MYGRIVPLEPSTLVIALSCSSIAQELRQTTVRPSQIRAVNGRGIDFNVESLCCYLETAERRMRKMTHFKDEEVFI